MQSTRYALLLAGAVLASAQVEALAGTCYFVFDRNETVIYRDAQPPVDMSFRGAAARETMRQRGEFLMFVDTEPCAPMAFLTGPGTPGTLSVADIVDGFPTTATSDGVMGNAAKPANGGANQQRMVGVSRGGVGVTRTQSAPASNSYK